MKQSGISQDVKYRASSISTRMPETAKEFRVKDYITRAHKLILKAIVGLLEDLHRIEVKFHSFEFSVYQLVDLLKDVETIQCRRQMLLILKGINNLEVKG